MKVKKESLTRNCSISSELALLCSFPVKCVRVMSIAVRYGNDMETMTSSTKAAKRKKIPGMQNDLGIIGYVPASVSFLISGSVGGGEQEGRRRGKRT